MSHNNPPDIILRSFLILFMISAFMLGWLFWPFISVLIIGAVVTSIFNPFFQLFKRKMPPWAASILTCLVIFLILFVPIVLFVGILSKEAYDLYVMGKNAAIDDQIKYLLEHSRILERVNLFLADYNIEITGVQLNRALSEVGKVVGLFIYQQASAIASNVLNFFIYFFFMLLIVYFLLIDSHKLISFIFDLSPLPQEQETKLIQKFRDMSGAVLVGNGICGIIQGILGGVVFSIFGLQSPFMWGVIMALLAFLPILGIGIVLLPTAAYLIITGRIGVGIFFVVFYVILSGGIEYVLKPKLVGQRVQMHTLLVFLSIIGGLKLFGILGIIYGPLVVTGFLTLTDIYNASYRTALDRTSPDG